MNEYPESRDEESPVISGPAPAPDVENPLVTMSLATTLTKAEIDTQISTAHAFPRSAARARDMMISLATMDDLTAEECVYALPRGGKTIRGPSIRFAEIVLNCWGNVRSAARVTYEDRIERFVEAEAVCHDLETNVGFIARVRRRIELKKGRKVVDPDMIGLAGAAAVSIARRNAILGCVPKPVWRRAHEAVESVIKGDQKTLVERRDAAIAYFNKSGIATERVLKALEVAHPDDITLDHLVDLSGMRAALKSGEATLDQLFPVERAPEGPKPETLDEKLQAVSKVQPKAEESAPASGQRGPRSARKAAAAEQERLKAAGNAAAAKGMRAYTEWFDGLTPNETAEISPAQSSAWIAIAKQAAA
jgi:hypothetical protein